MARCTYDPTADFHGTTVYWYRRPMDRERLDRPRTVTITVTPVNDAPVCTGFAQRRPRGYRPGRTRSTPARTSTGTRSTYTRVANASHGTATVTRGRRAGPTRPSPTTTAPTRSPSGRRTASSPRTRPLVSISVTPVNDAPVATAAAVTTSEDTPRPSRWPARTSRPRPLTFTVVTRPARGSLSGTAPELTYTPAANYHGPDSFTFKGQRRSARLGRRRPCPSRSRP